MKNQVQLIAYVDRLSGGGFSELTCLFKGMANGIANSGYIPNDAAFGLQAFKVLSLRCKPGYPESAIVNGFLDLMADARQMRD